MTLTYKLGLDILKTYLQTKNEVSRLRFSKARAWTGQTDRWTDRWTDATESITTPHLRVVKIDKNHKPTSAEWYKLASLGKHKGCPRDVRSRDRDETETFKKVSRPSRDRDVQDRDYIPRKHSFTWHWRCYYTHVVSGQWNEFSIHFCSTPPLSKRIVVTSDI